MQTNSYWLDTAKGPAFPKLQKDLRVEVLVIGGGITGLTAAYLLSKAGRTVALVERGRIGQSETGHTTAHLTCATDTRLQELVKTFGREHARAVWDAGTSAMAQIQTNVRELDIDCELRETPGFLVAAPDAAPDEATRLRDEAALARELGFDASFVSTAPLWRRPGLSLANQLKFHPTKYVLALALGSAAQGAQIFEESEVAEFHDEPRRVQVNGHHISYDLAVLATHVPLQGNTNTLSAALFQTKLAGYSTYAVEARLTSGVYPEVMLWDTADPYLYLRIDRHADCDVAILGGEDHKTGQVTNTEACYQRLQEKLRATLPEGTIERHWSGQVIESADGLPYIGDIGNGQFLATGFAGNGMTFGTLAGMMALDLVAGVRNPWRDLFAVERKTLSAAWDYLRENSDYPYYMAKSRLQGAAEGGMGSLRPGEGRILRVDGKKVAAFCDDHGRTHALSAICPHLGCVVAWNEADRTWDCPCHGSRFQATGEVMCGPAEKALEPVQS
jgi:glycine/D-amino acid oxidase-like deaminating enzyme/nitrite reductase/ring-hydroxylating ferredoxin subunit